MNITGIAGPPVGPALEGDMRSRAIELGMSMFHDMEVSGPTTFSEADEWNKLIERVTAGNAGNAGNGVSIID
jgi:hypothetical protein